MKILKSNLKTLISEFKFNFAALLKEDEEAKRKYLDQKLELLTDISEGYEELLKKMQEVIDLDKEFYEDFQSDTELVYDDFEKFKKVLQTLIEDAESLMKD